MEKNDWLKQHMTADDETFDPPPLSRSVRRIVEARKQADRTLDVFGWIAAFLNLKVKLYQAVIGTAVIAFVYVLAGSRKNKPDEEASSSSFRKNIVAVDNHTFLPSIPTCMTDK